MRILILCFMIACLFVASVKTMEEASNTVATKEKFTKLPLQPTIKGFDGALWDFFRIRDLNSNYTKFIQDNHFTDVQFQGLAQLSPHALIAVLLVTLKQKNDTCAFIQMTSWSPIQGMKATLFSHQRVTSSHEITQVKIAQNSKKGLLSLILYCTDKKNMSKDLLIFDNSKRDEIALLEQKTLKNWAV